ncbi:GNAT family N-acetyltransferase [Telluribacter sp. SYSU D00476]|uniref:GNAT family N-acetyltransferase n=1 Tax=Telluribacter sp. SYSU D00476 TaxID=2811430 RepID=UPI001FF6A816|nr:GNAT family N-acetyltransferase [Telluribacter sp. SYSU D00476]
MHYREALPSDFPAMMVVRLAVRENQLSDPSLVTEAHYLTILHNGGKGWICEADGRLVGFSIVDMKHRNIWALFVDPAYEKKGIGRRLHDLMLDWSFGQPIDRLWLGTEPGSRADAFYEKAGWVKAGTQPNGEVRYEMTKTRWSEVRRGVCI